MNTGEQKLKQKLETILQEAQVLVTFMGPTDDYILLLPCLISSCFL